MSAVLRGYLGERPALAREPVRPYAGIHLPFVGVVGFVVAGSLYHVVGSGVLAANLLGVVWRHGRVLPGRLGGRLENAD